MGLPQTRETTFIKRASQVPAAFLNKVQDELIIARAQRTIVIDAAAAAILSGWIPDPAFGISVTGTNADVARVPIPVEVNERIISFTVVWQTTVAAGDLEASLRRTNAANADAGATNTTLGSTLSSATSANVQKQTHVLASPEVVAADKSYHVRVIKGTAAGSRVLLRVEVVVDRLVA